MTTSGGVAMTQNRSREDLIRFLDFMGEKGLIPVATASARRTAVAKTLAVLDSSEAENVIGLDLDLVMTKFENLNKHQFTPESLQAYRSRLKTSLKDFEAYAENPVSFRPKSSAKGRVAQKLEKPKIEAKVPAEPANLLPQNSPLDLPNVTVLPIALRQNLTVQIVGLPFDLTVGEAKKIANIILAHAAPSEAE